MERQSDMAQDGSTGGPHGGLSLTLLICAEYSKVNLSMRSSGYGLIAGQSVPMEVSPRGLLPILVRAMVYWERWSGQGRRGNEKDGELGIRGSVQLIAKYCGNLLKSKLCGADFF